MRADYFENYDFVDESNGGIDDNGAYWPFTIRFGVEGDRFPAHTITGELIAPFIRAAALFRPAPRTNAAEPSALPQQQRQRI